VPLPFGQHKGSHHKLRNADGRTVIVPLHRELARGTLRSTFDRPILSADEFITLLKG
jgi:hypothetical protein